MFNHFPYRVITSCPERRRVFLWAGEPGEGEPLAMLPLLFTAVFSILPPEPGTRLLLRFRLEHPCPQRDLTSIPRE